MGAGVVNGRPNILFVNTDQQPWDAIGALGNRFVRTPAIDRLLRNGMRFERSYCTDPVCCPARSSWATGRYSSETGCLFNGGLLHADIPDVAHWLRGGGYEPAHAGKWHVDGRYLPEQGAFRLLYFGRRHIGAGAGETYDPSAVRAVLDFLDTYDGRRPFYLQLGLVDPHDICEYLHLQEHNRVPDPVAAGLAAPDDLPPLPPNFAVAFEELALQRAFHRAGDRSLAHAAIRRGIRDWTERDWRGLAWHLYRHVERADQHLGLILAALAQSRFRDDTLIVFSVDHGEAAGRHGLFQKFSLYEEAIRVPLVFAELGDRLGIPRGAADREHLVSGVDLLPTILDYAGVAGAAPMRGRSLRPLIDGNAPADWPEYAYVESNVWGRAVVMSRFKYITEYRPRADEGYRPPRGSTHELGRELLFDLENDPWETRDVAAAFPAEIGRARERLRRHEAGLDSRPLNERSRPVMDAWRSALMENGASAAAAPAT